MTTSSRRAVGLIAALASLAMAACGGGDAAVAGRPQDSDGSTAAPSVVDGGSGTVTVDGDEMPFRATDRSAASHAPVEDDPSGNPQELRDLSDLTLDDLRPWLDAAAELPPTYVLIGAMAQTSFGDGQSFTNRHSTCSLTTFEKVDPEYEFESADVQLVSTFQVHELRNMGPNLGYSDSTFGYPIWGQYVGDGAARGDQGEEWSGTGRGTSEIGIIEVGLSASMHEGSQPTVEVFPPGHQRELPFTGMLVTGHWAGEAVENFTSARQHGSISVSCLFASPQIVPMIEFLEEQAGNKDVGFMWNRS